MNIRNVDIIITSNIEGVHTFKLAMNEFGDLQGPEFVSIMNGARPRAEKKVSETGPNYALILVRPEDPGRGHWVRQ